MSKTLSIAIVAVAAFAAGSSAVLAQDGRARNNMRAMDNDWRAVEQSAPYAYAPSARTDSERQMRIQQDPQGQTWNGFDRDGTSPRVDIQ